MPAVLIPKTHLIVWSTDADNAKMLLDIPFPMNQVTTDQLAFNLVDICPDNMIQISCNSLLCFAQIGKIDDYSKISQVKVCMFKFKIVYLLPFLTDFNNIYLKI